MFQTFTGNSRRPRQVNLSGRTNNPFAAVQSQGPPNALAHAQTERRARQEERNRLQAAKHIQKTWRGYKVRKGFHDQLRDRFDEGMGREGFEQSIELLSLLVRFARPGQYIRIDEARVLDLGVRISSQERHFAEAKQPYGSSHIVSSLLKFRQLLVSCLSQENTSYSPGIANSQVQLQGNQLIEILSHTWRIVPQDTAPRLQRQYASLCRPTQSFQELSGTTSAALKTLLCLPLKTREGCHGLLYGLLVQPRIPTPVLDILAQEMDTKLFFSELRSRSHEALQSNNQRLTTSHMGELRWTLAYVIYLNSAPKSKADAETNIDYISAVTDLLSIIKPATILDASHATHDKNVLFVREQLQKLIGPKDISAAFSGAGLLISSSSIDASVLANYILTLLRVFPRRADDVRMWIYRMSSSSAATNDVTQSQSTPAIKLFWTAVSKSGVYLQISSDSGATKSLLTGITLSTPSGRQTYYEWRLILLFFELYLFALRIIDDESFMASMSKTSTLAASDMLKLDQILGLTTFLKNLAFAIYTQSQNITQGTPSDHTEHSLAAYFGRDAPNSGPKTAPRKLSKGDSETDMAQDSIHHLKGLTTGLLRMLYERDSRRRFLPHDHWLVPGFQPQQFIQAVFQEHTYRQRLERENDDETTQEATDEDDMDGDGLIVSQHTQQVRRHTWRQQHQQRAARERMLGTIAPRLEILQNVPFFIPFATRVQIFREFVKEDQLERRGGATDPEIWRLRIMSRHSLSRDVRPLELTSHHATVQRERIFDDAFDQFFPLGEGLKEPIQITFKDRFDTIEAGIDGGGITKEFLTSITSEAFTSKSGYKLFSENDKNLLYPNPLALDELEDTMRQVGGTPGAEGWHATIRDLLQKYEFAGRIVGKCLYEGILVDVPFAPFFLQKWALTGGSGSTGNESGYRASINDLRDLDQELYQNLLKLKNYPGDVEELGLDFTVTDRVGTKVVNRPLRPSGADIAVTNQNRPLYIAFVAQYRLQKQPAKQTRAFLQGLGTMVSPHWLSMFNQSELQTLLSGDTSGIDVADLRNNTEYGGVYVIGNDNREHLTVEKFWEVMQELPDAERRKVLKYVTSTPRGPLLGFSHLNPKFSIRDSGNDQARLPSSSTCVNLLKLPIYTTKKTLREKLLYAINSGAGFDMS